MGIHRYNQAEEAYIMRCRGNRTRRTIGPVLTISVLVVYALVLQSTGCGSITSDEASNADDASGNDRSKPQEVTGSPISVRSQQGTLSWTFKESGWDCDVTDGECGGVSVICEHRDGRMLVLNISTWGFQESTWLRQNASAVVVQTVKRAPYTWVVLRLKDGSIVVKEDRAKIGIAPAGPAEDALPNAWMRSTPHDVLDSFRWTRNGSNVSDPAEGCLNDRP